MTLANLKKCGPSVNRQPVSVDEFIDGALRYANGCQNIVNLPVKGSEDSARNCHLKRATFTLGETAIGQLEALSLQTGIAKSRLIRIWLDRQHQSGELQDYLVSPIR